MLTPRDLLKVEFKTVFRGYSEEQVNDFIKKVVAAYEELYRENERLKAELEEERAKAAEVHRNEQRVDELLQLARKAVEDAQETARREADLILHEGRAMAAREAERVQAQYREQLERVRRLRHEEALIRRRIRLLLESLLHQLDEEPADFGEPGGHDGHDGYDGDEDEGETGADQLLAEWADRLVPGETAVSRDTSE